MFFILAFLPNITCLPWQRCNLLVIFLMKNKSNSGNSGNFDAGNCWGNVCRSSSWNMSITLLFPAGFAVNNKINKERAVLVRVLYFLFDWNSTSGINERVKRKLSSVSGINGRVKRKSGKHCIWEKKKSAHVAMCCECSCGSLKAEQ